MPPISPANPAGYTFYVHEFPAEKRVTNTPTLGGNGIVTLLGYRQVKRLVAKFVPANEIEELIRSQEDDGYARDGAASPSFSVSEAVALYDFTIDLVRYLDDG